MAETDERLTPWRRVAAAFGVSQIELARIVGRHRSKICRSLKCGEGLIPARDQVILMREAQKRGLDLNPLDLLPTGEANQSG